MDGSLVQPQLATEVPWIDSQPGSMFNSTKPSFLFFPQIE
jgi:hypothetical protein